MLRRMLRATRAAIRAAIGAARRVWRAEMRALDEPKICDACHRETFYGHEPGCLELRKIALHAMREPGRWTVNTVSEAPPSVLTSRRSADLDVHLNLGLVDAMPPDSPNDTPDPVEPN